MHAPILVRGNSPTSKIHPACWLPTLSSLDTPLERGSSENRNPNAQPLCRFWRRPTGLASYRLSRLLRVAHGAYKSSKQAVRLLTETVKGHMLTATWLKKSTNHETSLTWILNFAVQGLCIAIRAPLIQQWIMRVNYCSVHSGK